MADNLKIWKQLEKTPPSATKRFNKGTFSGTAYDPIYVDRKLTETFGAYGIGWRTQDIHWRHAISAFKEHIELDFHDESIICEVELAVKHNGEWQGGIRGVGGTRLYIKRKSGEWVPDEEAYKKAFTDAIGNATKHLGLAADIFEGKFDDNKYVEQRAAEEEREQNAAKQDEVVEKASVVYGEILHRLNNAGTLEEVDAIMEEERTTKLIGWVHKYNERSQDNKLDWNTEMETIYNQRRAYLENVSA
jgi:hypothetical protein